MAKRCTAGNNNGPGDGARGLRRVMEEILEGPQFDVPGGSVRYVLITEDVVNGKLAPLYFGRDGKVLSIAFLSNFQDRFHETIVQEEDEYLARTQKSGKQPTDLTYSKSSKAEQQKEACGAIP